MEAVDETADIKHAKEAVLRTLTLFYQPLKMSVVMWMKCYSLAGSKGFSYKIVG